MNMSLTYESYTIPMTCGLICGRWILSEFVTAYYESFHMSWFHYMTHAMSHTEVKP